jgi:hypothetical protein
MVGGHREGLLLHESNNAHKPSPVDLFSIALISVEVVDHIVVAGNNTVSMADRGLL